MRVARLCGWVNTIIFTSAHTKPLQSGESVLHKASELGHVDIASLLITQGAPLCATNVFGESARDLAMIGGFEEIAIMIEHALAHGTWV